MNETWARTRRVKKTTPDSNIVLSNVTREKSRRVDLQKTGEFHLPPLLPVVYSQRAPVLRSQVPPPRRESRRRLPEKDASLEQRPPLFW